MVGACDHDWSQAPRCVLTTPSAQAYNQTRLRSAATSRHRCFRCTYSAERISRPRAPLDAHVVTGTRRLEEMDGSIAA